jgi:hypothetical protein
VSDAAETGKRAYRKGDIAHYIEIIKQREEAAAYPVNALNNSNIMCNVTFSEA